MKEHYRKVVSKADGLPLDVVEVLPAGKVRGIVQIVHGMAEHKERYLHFMDFLASHGYACVASDHRGHGKSVYSDEDLGYFYDESGDAIVEDLNDVAADLRLRYPHVPFYMIGHSMGSLIVRKYLKKYDDQIDKLVISGAVYENPKARPAKKLTKALGRLGGDRAHSKLIDSLATGFDKGLEGTNKNRWISYNQDNVEQFNNHPLDGFSFSLNGYTNLFQLIEDVYSPEGWQVKNPDLPVLFAAGKDDPVTGGHENYLKTVQHLKGRGYTHVKAKEYPHMRHEILNEINRDIVYRDILRFLEDDGSTRKTDGKNREYDRYEIHDI